MENLISGTDYTIQQFDLLFTDKISRDTFIDRVITYSKFLKKPIQKIMFVPCDELNNILEEPTPCSKSCSPIDYCVGGKCDIEGCYGQVGRYEKAKERVLFDGWGFFQNSLSGAETGVRNEVVFNDNVIYFYEDRPAMFVSADLTFKTPIYTIEDLFKTGLDLKLTDKLKKLKLI
jgi:hypothetical protein